MTYLNGRILLVGPLLLGALTGCLTKRGANRPSSAAMDSGSNPISSSLLVDSSIYDRTGLKFTPHAGPVPFGSYLVEDVNYAPVAALRQELEAQLSFPIQNRGEAHITVITPVEYAQVLAPHLTIAEINQLASDAHIEAMPFKVLCLGEGKATISGQSESTFYIVIDSPPLLELRHQIQSAFAAAGGDIQNFDAEHFLPHITLGFTKRDLFEQDGVYKTTATCIRQLELAAGS